VNKRILLGLFVSSMIFLMGCAQQDDLAKGPFIGGTDGLDFGFVAGEPPASVFDNNQEDFDITINVENVGEFNIPSNSVIATLGGIDSRDFGISSPNRILKTPLNGKTKSDKGEVFRGDQDELRYENAKYKPDLVADFSTQIRADVCYLYQTRATTKACLKKKASSREVTDFCQVNNDNIKVENSAAPVQIRGVAERSAGTNEVQLTFVVENVGSGKVYPKNTFSSECIRKEDKEDKLEIEVRTGSGRHGVKCSQLGNSNKGEIRLSTDKQKQIRCRISTSGAPENAVEEPINIIINYFYRDAISTPLTIEDSEN